MDDMTNPLKKVAERIGRAVGHTSKTARAEQAAAQLDDQRHHAQPPSNVAEEGELGGHRYLRP